eukprot:gene4230-14344_t
MSDPNNGRNIVVPVDITMPSSAFFSFPLWIWYLVLKFTCPAKIRRFAFLQTSLLVFEDRNTLFEVRDRPVAGTVGSGVAYGRMAKVGDGSGVERGGLWPDARSERWNDQEACDMIIKCVLDNARPADKVHLYHVLHKRTKNGQIDTEDFQKQEEEAKACVMKHYSHLFDMHKVEIGQVISHHAEELDAKMIIMLRHHRSSIIELKTFFIGSITKYCMNHCKVQIGQVVSQHAEELDAKMIIMMRHHRKHLPDVLDIKTFFIGSVTKYCMLHCKQPVFVVNPR